MIRNDGCVVTNGNVVLVDPNCVNTEIGLVNEIPQYEKMYIFVDLTATRRGRTVLQTGLPVQTDGTISINMMGFNQDKDTSYSSHGNFTTNYYDGSTGERKQYESFGIENIKVTINSSFIPQINITFVDIRGLSFFNNQPDGEDSPYRILFDFPPPIFELSLRGYYGRAIKYKLHLVKYTTDFKSDNGNFYVDAQFVALTFAPLADILFRYVINFPLIQEGVSPKPEDKPNNTFDLITKVHRLNHAEDLFNKTDIDNQNYDKIIKTESGYQNLLTTLRNAPTSSIIIQGSTNVGFLIRDTSVDVENNVENNPFSRIENISGFNDVILSQQRLGRESSPDKKLYLAYYLGSVGIDEVEDINISGGINAAFRAVTNTYNRRILRHLQILDDYRTDLIRISSNTLPEVRKEIFEGGIKTPAYLRTNYSPTGYTENRLHTYAYIDISELYVYLFKGLGIIRENKSDTISALNTKINNMILGNLGMKPTIYNIFKIILDDVDKMFNIMRNTSIQAQDYHHNIPEIRDRIIAFNYRDVGQNGDKPYIYAYPLVIDNVTIDGVTREERVAPIKISETLGSNPFPELVLIDNFIDSFRRQSNIYKQITLRLIQNTDGTDKWIPISPFDSKINSPNISTPYFGIDTGGSQSTPTPTTLLSTNKTIQIMTVVLNRFYVLTQYVYPYAYRNSINANVNRKTSKNLIKFFAESEAINLSNSITNAELKNLMLEFSKSKINNIEAFNLFLNREMNRLYNLNVDSSEISGTNAELRDFIRLDENHYINKNNPNFVGCKINFARGYTVSLSVDDVVTSGTDKKLKKSDKRIVDFSKNIKPRWFEFTSANDISVRSFGYLDENLFFFRNNSDDNVKYINNKYVVSLSTIQTATPVSDDMQLVTDRVYIDGGGVKFNEKRVDLINRIVSLKPNSNEYWGNSAISGNINKKVGENNLLDIWANTIVGITTNFNEVSDILFTNQDRKIASILLLSNFGYTASVFNTLEQNLNNTIFSVPSVIELPLFMTAYLGALVDIEISDDDETYNKLREFFIGGAGNGINSGGILIFADIVDIKNCLSEKDKEQFRMVYNDFMTPRTGGFDNIIESFQVLYNQYLILLAQLVRDKDRRIRQKSTDFIRDSLNNGGDYYDYIIAPLVRNVYLLNYSELTFKRKSEALQENFVALSQLNNNYADYFNEFFTHVKNYLSQENKEDNDADAEARKLSGDRDIINQTYYSFKNINDKWLTNAPKNNVTGFTFNEEGGSLIDLFAFVDRAMNPAGDTVINPEILVDLMEDPNVTLYGVLSQLLSSNGFEFFPLQNFMSFENDKSWEDSFKIDESGKIKDSPNFVCMYIGGSSRYITGISKLNNFVDDGIIDLSGPGLGRDFVRSADIQDNPENDNQRASNTRFPWGQVRAFRVRFAQQNQSMFKDIKIESKEFPETNESIQILSRLAGDSRANAPVPKGQNLYNLYENRAYSTTITGLGNMMIQPTQYFQLENVPLYNGAYMILSVEHDISANKMNTSFTGTKILKYPIPRVTNVASILGFDEGDTVQTNPGLASQAGGGSGRGTTTLGGGTNQNPDEAKYYSMYEQKIEE